MGEKNTYKPPARADCGFLELRDRQSLLKESGLVLNEFASGTLKKVQEYTSVSRAQSLDFIQLDSDDWKRMGWDPQQVISQLQELVELKLILQLFYFIEAESGHLELQTVFVSGEGSESFFALYEIYSFLMSLSFSSLQSYISEHYVLNPSKLRAFLFQKKSPTDNYSQIEKLLHKASIPISEELIHLSVANLKENLFQISDILELEGHGLWKLPSEKFKSLERLAMEKLESKFIPEFVKIHPDSEPELDSILKEQAEAEIEDPNSLAAFQSAICRTILKSDHQNQKVQVLARIFERAEELEEAERKSESKRFAKVFKTMLDRNYDFDSRLLRIDFEENEFSPAVFEQLRTDMEILHTIWYENSRKYLIAVKMDVRNIKEINQEIFNRFRDDTHHILYLRAVLEANEKRAKPVFQDPEFVKVYGQNLRTIYFKFIPWYYKIFFYLGLSKMVDTGFEIAKSLVRYKQMNAEMEYQSRMDRLRKKKAEAKTKHKNQFSEEKLREFISSAIDDCLYGMHKLPTTGRILESHPVLSESSLESMASSIGLRKIAIDDYIAWLPASNEENQPRWKKLNEIAYSIQEDPNASASEVKASGQILQLIAKAPKEKN